MEVNVFAVISLFIQQFGIIKISFKHFSILAKTKEQATQLPSRSCLCTNCCLIECVSYKIHSKTKLGNRKKTKIVFNFIPQNQRNIMEVKEIVKAEISRANK